MISLKNSLFAAQKYFFNPQGYECRSGITVPFKTQENPGSLPLTKSSKFYKKTKTRLYNLVSLGYSSYLT